MADVRWLNIRQACEVARVSRRTIYNWLAAGKLITRRTAGGSVRIAESSLWQEDYRLHGCQTPALGVRIENA